MHQVERKSLSQEIREDIAKEAIRIANEFEYRRGNQVSLNSLRNILGYLNKPNISSEQFNVWLYYQSGRAKGRREKQFPHFVSVYKKTATSLFDQYEITDNPRKLTIFKELIKSIIMGATFRDETQNHEKLKEI